ncbi:MAG: hypothetical protein EXS08_10640 [Planctomycetes bacterium]|nr:hypothetical protein [Planctomycetota bacterium]
MSTRLEIHGEWFVTLATAAECYHVELRTIEAVFAHGLLGPGERVGDSFAFPERELDRLALVLRWHRHHGFDLEAVLGFLGG